MKYTIVIIFLFFLFLPSTMYAADYVLPYPSYMPGNKMYKVMQIIDYVQGYWMWGNIAQHRYHLQLSDKYLVEAKTLFEYKQYLLAFHSLEKSTSEFQLAQSPILNAYSEGKDIKNMTDTYIAASEKHKEVLQLLLKFLPEEFTWTPEKEQSQELPLHEMITKSIEMRSNNSRDIDAFLRCVQDRVGILEVENIKHDCWNVKNKYYPQEIQIPNTPTDSSPDTLRNETTIQPYL